MTKKELEQDVLKWAMRDYWRLKGFGWHAGYLEGVPRRLWTACRRLATAQRKRKKVKS